MEKEKVSRLKNVENIPAKMLSFYDDVVVLECFIAKDIYEEREFNLSLFSGFEIKIGNFFLLKLYEGKNEARIKICDGSKLELDKYFPKIDFVEKFKDFKLFKK